MIPLELRVRNFMCYREMPPLHFDGIHVACLAGPNGHGKSALLDAITWALWGKARVNRDNELIHLGESEMEVEYTFALGGNVYRVLRKRDSTGRGRSVLDLQVRAPGDDGAFQSIAESGVRATEQAIIDLLRMDYDTFTNSAFLVQGQADAFTTRTPAERKQILGEILGLGLYDEYEQRAKEKSREKDRELAELDGLLRDIDREVARRPQYEAELARAKEAVAELSEAFREAETALRDLRHEQQTLEHQQAQLRDLGRRLKEASQEVGDIEAQITERSERLAGYESALAHREEVETGYADLLAARDAEAAWNERLDAYTRVQERRGALQRTVDAARHEFELARGRVAERVADLEERAGRLVRHENALERARERLAALEAKQAERDAAVTTIQELREEEAALKARNEEMYTEMEGLRRKLDVLQDETGEATCPVCGQSLSDEHRRELAAEYGTEGNKRRDTYRANERRLTEIEREVERLQVRVKGLDHALEALPAERRREAQADQAAAEARAAKVDLDGAREELDGLDQRLQAGEYAAEAQAELSRLVAELKALGYERDAHQAARERVSDLARFEAAYRRLENALDRVDDERAALADLRARLDRWEGRVAADRQRHDQLGAEVARLPGVVERVMAKAAEVDDVQQRSSRARQALGAAQQRLDHCDYLVEERARRAADRQRVVEEKAVFDELRLAFGKKGVQAMIIEAAIPEIEFEANRLLARMTDGRMHVRFETQRELQSGETRETLDINIADELGTRSYELFSGGEAFRVNFAIRIALSKLLARRAGAQLQLLVIDEGFGTQDAEGRARLVEAINSIQEDFERILVVTHIEELKDAFPVRIEVTKTEDGSVVRLN
ncbi:MAG: SMC family ATPase [Anaerolineae bacterium]|jgi:exonuclease SbcC